jgi:hypothetical protein
MDEPTARVEVGPNGELVFIDPMAYAVAKAISKHNCKNTLAANADRIVHFRNRVIERGLNPKNAVIVVANVDDTLGAILADALMPGFNWEEIRQRGETPFARGLAERDGVIKFVKKVDPEIVIDDNPKQVQIIVVDHGTCEIF